ncbi:MAG: tRNA (adenosine(37)-N6)-threonylcarbamoyltransferase complex ATPase subunit type 1 TsaE [Planctomycetota bacterium]|nr:tRNA (adenosine(37)-N6)-threonylcarbamoyltransferase complex ATPase subunit type 1 TsaE [Planctomycetota bacterium]
MTNARPVHILFRSRSPAETRRLGRELARFAVQGQEFMLVGEYGCGKTQFVKGLAAGLGVRDAARRVTSPTFVLHGMHPGRLTLHHVDAHRLRTKADLEAIGWPDLFGDGVLAIEWADTVFPEYTRPANRLAREVRATGEPHRASGHAPSGAAAKGRAGWTRLDPASLGPVRAALRRVCVTEPHGRRPARPVPILVLFRHAGPRERLMLVTTGGSSV